MGSVEESSDISTRNILPTTQDVNDASSKNDGRDKTDVDGSKTSVMELFSWISEFKKMCRASLSQRSMASLVQLMNYYTRNVCQNVNECYTKPFRAAKLKESISEALLFFLYYCRELSEVQDRTVYLVKMSDLLSMYMDMELKASKTGKEHRSKITARLTSCLYVYLENSTEHLLNTLIKVRFMSRNYQDILDPIITKIFKSIPERPDSDLMYVRYLLGYRLWKKVNSDAAVKSQINVTAVSSLGQPPTALPSFLTKYVLPKVPKSQINSTKFLLLHKFDVEQSCRQFARYCTLTRNDDSRDKDMQTLGANDVYKDAVRIGNSIDSRVSEKIRETESELSSATIAVGNGATVFKESNEIVVESTKETTGQEVSGLPVSRTSRTIKVLPRRKPKKKTSEIVIIDLTSEEVSEVVIKKRKRKRLAWVQEAKKRINMKAVKAARKKEKRKRIGIKVNGGSDAILSSVHQLEDTFNFQSLSVNEDSEPKDMQYACVTSDSGIDGDKVESSGCDLSPTRNVDHPIDEGSTAMAATMTTPINNSTSSIPAVITGKTVIADSSSTDIPHSTSSSRDKESFSSATGYSRETISEVSNALSNISKYYDSDSALEVSSDANPDSSSVSNYRNNNNQDKKSDAGLGSDSESDRSKTIEVHKVSPEITKYLTEIQSPLNVSLNLRNAEDNVHNRSSKIELTDEEDQSSHSPESSIRVNLETRTEAICKNEKDHHPTVNLHNAKLPARGNYTAVVSYELGVDSKLIRNTSEQKPLEEKLMYKRQERKVKKRTNETCETDGIVKDGKQDGGITNVTEYFTVDTIIRDKFPKGQRVNMDISSSSITQTTTGNSAQKIFEERDSAYDSRFNGNSFSAESTEYQEHIDGLSLLASVSQQVPHLMARPKIVSGSTETVLIKRNIDDETDTSDSSNTVIQFCENPPTEIINEIVGIYPEDALDKVALQVEVTSTEADSTENNSLNVVPIVMDSAADLSGSIVQNNLVSIESHGQPVKECTNVILNGETIVLLQKSPNSNLYIINKAVENKADLEEGTTGLREEDSIKEENLLCSEVMDSTGYTELVHNNRQLPWKENKSLLASNMAVKVEPEEDNNSTLYYEDPRYKSSYKYNSYRCDEEPVKSDNQMVELSNLQHSDTSNSITELKPTLHASPPAIRHQPGQAVYQDSALSTKKKKKSKGKRKSKVTSNTNLSCKTANVKQEFNACTNNASNHQTSDYGIQSGCPVAAQHPLHIPVTHPTTLPSIYAVQASVVKDDESKMNDDVLTKLYDDQLLHKIEKSIFNDKPNQEADVKYRQELANKLPLKKRLKAHAMMSMSYEHTHGKVEKPVNYPSTPMMSIAALEAQAASPTSGQDRDSPLDPSSLEDEPLSHYHNRDMIRRDYCKDITHVPNGHHNQTDDRSRKLDHLGGKANGQSNGCHKVCCQRGVKRPAQNNKDISSSSPSSIKRLATGLITQVKTPKKLSTAQEAARRTRSSKRNVPKVNYSCLDVDPEWNLSGESKRRRKRTSR
ncbi:uncharacterized protein LOC107269228 isoform X2 [Cephus cinctus]|uniref:Uncharacterized protein LOC107269228 isoform X2 n=1 Tax=Cephus cinctus TaxID=211228 RepID=A0AAJ7C098_CEPCN|nr:uncharacterized protein LOC107269228 isoform X2 [Cephus cinctus]